MKSISNAVVFACVAAVVLAMVASAQPSVSAGTVTVTVPGSSTNNKGYCSGSNAPQAAITLSKIGSTSWTTIPTVSGTKTCDSSNNYCDTANSAVCFATTTTSTTNTVSGTPAVTLHITTLPDDGSVPDTTIASPSTGVPYTITLAQPTTAQLDGSRTVVVTATPSDTATQTLNTRISYLKKTLLGCVGNGGSTSSTTPLGSTTVTGAPVLKTVVDAYQVDLAPPVLAVAPLTFSSVHMGDTVLLGTGVAGGSPKTPFTLTDRLGTGQTSASGTFDWTGLDARAMGVQVPCTTAPGLYTPEAELSSLSNICGGSFANVKSQWPFMSVNVESGLPALTMQTAFLADMPNGQFTTQTCFTSKLNSQNKISTSPGSSHVVALVRVPSPTGCFDASSTVSQANVRLSLPNGFVYLYNGKRPQVQVFLGSGNFDSQDPTASAYANVTALSTQTVTGGTQDVIALNLGKQVPILGDTIVVMAHVQYVGAVAPIPMPHQFSAFADVTMVNSSGVATTVSGGPSSALVMENPLLTCKDGNVTMP